MKHRTLRLPVAALLCGLATLVHPASADYKFVGNVTATNKVTGTGGISSGQWAKITSYVLFGGAPTASLPTPPSGQSGILLDTTTNQVKYYNIGAAAWEILPGLATGTTNTIAKFTSATALGNSDITDDGNVVTVQKALNLQTVTKTTSYVLANETVVLCDATSGAQNETLPDPTLPASKGRLYILKKIDSSGNACTELPHAAETQDGASSVVLSHQYDQVSEVTDGTNWFVVGRMVSPLPVANGGTGAATLAAHGVVVGRGASAVNVTTAGSSGNVLTSNGASADPTWQSAATGNLQAVMGASPNATSTVAVPMILTPTSGAAFSATTVDNHYAVSANGTGNGEAYYGNVTGDRIVADFERGYLGGASTAPLLNIHDTSQTASTADLIKAIGNSNTTFFELNDAGTATLSALGNAGYLSSAGGVVTANAGTPITSEPSWDTTLGVSNSASHNLAFGADKTYDIGSSTDAPRTIYASDTAGVAFLSLKDATNSVTYNIHPDATPGTIDLSGPGGIWAFTSGNSVEAETFIVNNPSGPTLSSGSADPSGACTEGSLYLRLTYTALHKTLWVCENATWTAGL